MTEVEVGFAAKGEHLALTGMIERSSEPSGAAVAHVSRVAVVSVDGKRRAKRKKKWRVEKAMVLR